MAVDADQLDLVYEEHGARLWRAILLYSGDPDVASDAVAEAFAQVLRRGDAVDSPERWVWRSAFRIAAGELLRRVRGSRDRPRTSPTTANESRRQLDSAARVHLELG